MVARWLQCGTTVQQYTPEGKVVCAGVARVCGVQCSGVEMLTRVTMVCNGTALYNRPAVQSKGGNFFSGGMW